MTSSFQLSAPGNGLRWSPCTCDVQGTYSLETALGEEWPALQSGFALPLFGLARACQATARTVDQSQAPWEPYIRASFTTISGDHLILYGLSLIASRPGGKQDI